MNKYLAVATVPILLALSACIAPPANDELPPPANDELPPPADDEVPPPADEELPVPGISIVSLGSTDLSGVGSGGNVAYVEQYDGSVYADFFGYIASFTDDSVTLTLELYGDSIEIDLPYVEELGAYALIADGTSIVAYAFGDEDHPDAVVFKVVMQTDIDDFTGYGATSFADAGSAFLPTEGSATYAGGLEATDHLGAVANGSVELLVNFLDQSISGGFSIEDGTVFGEASFSLGASQVNSIEADWVNFYNDIESTDTNIAYSSFMTSISGENSEYATGIFFLMNDSDEALAGAFTASQ
jgi:hypothetical protein